MIIRRTSTTRTIGLALVGVIGLAACGGSSSDQDKLAASLVAEARSQGFEIDESCAEDVAAQFSDEDAEKLIDAGDDVDIDAIGLSPEGQQIAVSVLSCVDPTEFADEFIDGIESSGITVDRACATDLLTQIDFATFDPNNPPADIIEGLIPCILE